MDIFISSEMEISEDMERRKSAIEEIRELGHTPIYFEGLPGRPLTGKQDTPDKYREMVCASDILVIIVDDTVSEGMKDELKEAENSLGDERIFYYFTRNERRDKEARDLWEYAKKENILKEFETPYELRKEIKKSIASYIEDALKKKEKTAEMLMDESIYLTLDGEWYKLFKFNKEDVVTITCFSNSNLFNNGNFYVGLFPREEYIKRRTGGIFFRFDFDSKETSAYTDKVVIPEDDDYYLVLRRGISQLHGVMKVQIRMERRQR